MGPPTRSALETPGARRIKNVKTRDVTLVAVYAAMYAAMVVVFAPISFSAMQFRVAGALRPGIAKKVELAVGYAVGVAVANVFSPFAGFYEILFMPFMSLLAGLAGHYLARRFNGSYIVCGVVIALIIPLSVAWMLNQLFSLPLLVTLPGLLVSEQVINLLGATVFKAVETRIRWWET